MDNECLAVGDRYYAKGKFKRASQIYLEVLSKDGANIKAREGLAQCYCELGKLEEAKQECRMLMEFDKKRPIPYYILGLIFEREDRLSESQEILKHVLELDPDFASAYNALGTVKARQGNLDESAESYYKAIRLDPSLWKAHFNLATVLRAQGHFSEALEENIKALKLAPSFRNAYWALVSYEFKYPKHFGVANIILLLMLALSRSFWLIPFATLLFIATIYRASIWFKAGKRARGLTAIVMGFGVVLWYLYIVIKKMILKIL